MTDFAQDTLAMRSDKWLPRIGKTSSIDSGRVHCINSW